MATGDISVSVTIEGGLTKTATVASAVREKSIEWANNSRGTEDEPDYTDETWSVVMANRLARSIAHAADKQLLSDATPAAATVTEAT